MNVCKKDKIKHWPAVLRLLLLRLEVEFSLSFPSVKGVKTDAKSGDWAEICPSFGISEP